MHLSGENNVIALVADDFDNEDANNLVVGYTKGTKMVKKIKSLRE